MLLRYSIWEPPAPIWIRHLCADQLVHQVFGPQHHIAGSFQIGCTCETQYLERGQLCVAPSKNVPPSHSVTPSDFSQMHFIPTVCACCCDDTEHHQWGEIKLKLIKGTILMLCFESCSLEILFSPAWKIFNCTEMCLKCNFEETFIVLGWWIPLTLVFLHFERHHKVDILEIGCPEEEWNNFGVAQRFKIAREQNIPEKCRCETNYVLSAI